MCVTSYHCTAKYQQRRAAAGRPARMGVRMAVLGTCQAAGLGGDGREYVTRLRIAAPEPNNHTSSETRIQKVTPRTDVG